MRIKLIALNCHAHENFGADGGGGPGRAAICQWCKTIAAAERWRDTSIALLLLSLSYICFLGCYSSLSVPFVTVDTARRPLARCTHVHILYLRLPLFNICCCCSGLRVCLCVWVRSWKGENDDTFSEMAEPVLNFKDIPHPEQRKRVAMGAGRHGIRRRRAFTFFVARLLISVVIPIDTVAANIKRKKNRQRNPKMLGGIESKENWTWTMSTGEHGDRVFNSPIHGNLECVII